MSNNLTYLQLTHPLALYREKYQLSFRQLAKLLKLSPQIIYNYIQQISYPSEHIKQQIAILTNQEVPLDSWPATPPRKPKGSVSLTPSNHPLELYRQKLGISYLALAQLLDIQYQRLHLYLSGKVYPPIKVKEKIALLTKQEVPVESWPPSSKRKPGRPEGIGKPLKKRTP